MKTKSRLDKTSILTGFLSLVVALGIGLSLSQFNVDPFEFFTYDLRMRYKPNPPTSGHLQTVVIEAETLKHFQQEPDIKAHKEVLQKILNSSPKAVVYILNPSEIAGLREEKFAFAELASQSKKFYFAINDLPPAANEELLQLPPPLDKIPVFAGPTTADRNTFGKDGVSRRMILASDGVSTIHPILAAEFNGIKNPTDYRGVFDFLGSTQAFINYHKKGSYPAVSFLEIINSEGPLDQFRDKIVILGRDTVEITNDYVRTPYSKDVVSMSALELHANMFDTLILNSAPVRAPQPINLFLTCLIAVFTLYVVRSLRPATGLLTLALTLSGFVLGSYLVAALFDYWIAMAHPLLAIFICYYFFIPYRLIVENRKTWEYAQKNRLLTQVEELKSNFLRMMSHDLKTPLARIQGMANLVLSDKEKLSQEQQKALATITESSEELSDFIGSILDLGRIEGKEVKLNVKSRDINSLLADIVAKNQYLAQKKNITIIQDFEPLFSVKMDEDLMRQVFTNLVENAIKYSPENSRILVSTEEINGRVHIQVADQGYGIPKDEIENVFAKFYRSRDFKNSEIQGSGLGLYLAKYFVELHQGKIAVESEVKSGSTFTVELPL